MRTGSFGDFGVHGSLETVSEFIRCRINFQFMAFAIPLQGSETESCAVI